MTPKGVVYVTTQGAAILRRGERLEVVHEGKKLADLRLFELERLILVGNVQLTTQALALLFDRGIDVSFLTSHGRPRGSLVSGQSKNVYLRLAQFERWRDGPFRLELARRLVRSKLLGQCRLLLRQARNYPGEIDGSIAERIRGLAGDLDQRETVEEVRGVEGAGSALYFRAFGSVLRSMPFPGRNRHPATDPVNALLSLGYVLLTNEIAGMLEVRGFDPFIGFFHGIRYGRQSLPLDLVEPFRPALIDRLTIRLFNLKQFTAEDFEGGEQGLRLQPDGFKRYLGVYEEALSEPSEGQGSPAWRQVAGELVDRLKMMVMQGSPGEVYTWPG